MGKHSLKIEPKFWKLRNWLHSETVPRTFLCDYEVIRLLCSRSEFFASFLRLVHNPTVTNYHIILFFPSSPSSSARANRVRPLVVVCCRRLGKEKKKKARAKQRKTPHKIATTQRPTLYSAHAHTPQDDDLCGDTISPHISLQRVSRREAGGRNIEWCTHTQEGGV